MKNICCRIIFIILPVLFVIGIFRIIFNAENEFLPTASDFLNRLNNAPNLMTVLNDSISSINSSLVVLRFSADHIDSLQSFFLVINNFFSFVGTCLMLVVNTLSGCIAWFIWVLGFLFGFNVL